MAGRVAGPRELIQGEILTILNESGVPDVVSPLHGLSGLAEDLGDALIFVVGTRADAHLALSLTGPLPGSPAAPTLTDEPKSPGVSFVVIEPDERPEGGALASHVVEAASGSPGVGVVLLVACRSARLLGVDPYFEAELVERRLGGLPVRAIETASDVSGILSTDLTDEALRVLVGLSPRGVTGPEHEEPTPAKGGTKGSARAGLLGRLTGRSGGREVHDEAVERRPVVLLGGASGSRGELAAELRRAGVEVGGSVPADERGGVPGGVPELPAVGEGTVVAVLDPYLVRAAREAEERGARVVRTLFPVGVDGTARFISDVVAATGGVTSEGARSRRVWEDMEHLRARIRGKRVFFTGDTGLEIPLARFLANAGAVVLEVGTPRLEKRFLGVELSALGSDVDVVEAPDWQTQLGRIEAARPDVVVAGPGLFVPLVARGHLCRSSLDILALDPRGYEGARRVLALFARTFERADAMDALNL